MREARAGSRPPGLKSAEPLTRKALPMDSIQVPARVKNLTGMMFGRLEVIAYAGIDKHRTAKWVCRCTGPHCAGKQVIVLGTRLRKGHTRSCGCLSSEMSAERARDRLTTHGLSGHPLFNVWAKMIARCTNPKSRGYADYGGRGITVCEAWLGSFEAFYRDMSPGYEPGLQMDRRDNDGPYAPSNCRWVTRSQNGRNKRNSRIVEFAGQRRCVAEWAELLGMSPTTLRNRLDSGWPVARALTEAVAPACLAELGLAE